MLRKDVIVVDTISEEKETALAGVPLPTVCDYGLLFKFVPIIICGMLRGSQKKMSRIQV